MNILIISDNPTHPTSAGNRSLILSNAEMLTSFDNNIDFLWVPLLLPAPSADEVFQMKEYWQSHLIIFKKWKLQLFNDKFFKEFRFKLSGHYNVDDLFPFALLTFLRKLQDREKYDCVIVNYIYFSKCFCVFNNARKILLTHDVFTDCNRKDEKAWFSTTSRQEAKALNRADIVWAVQENEADFFKSLTTREVITTFSYFPVKATQYIGNKALLFLSGPNKHNIAAINDFILNKFPRLYEKYPDIRLVIGGAICPEISQYKNNKYIDMVGMIKNAEEFYSLGDIVINPTFSGMGLKIKTFEAMAFGKVVICHPHSTEGIYQKEKAPVLLAETAEDYLRHLDSLFIDVDKTKCCKEKSIVYMKVFGDIVRQRIRSSFI